MISPLEIFHLSPALLYTCPRMAADPDAPPKPSLSPPPRVCHPPPLCALPYLGWQRTPMRFPRHPTQTRHWSR